MLKLVVDEKKMKGKMIEEFTGDALDVAGSFYKYRLLTSLINRRVTK